ncbi:hypothetical protein ASF88_08090 [Leifsonia sp. Leaf336]|nr:hypothetical protein [Leifsonia sp. Leaf336]KQR54700.1 hypothetical protein ASF88_08090 [Leifsonia sp. Leaf336]
MLKERLPAHCTGRASNGRLAGLANASATIAVTPMRLSRYANAWSGPHPTGAMSDGETAKSRAAATIGHQVRIRAAALRMASFWKTSSIPIAKTGRYCSMSAVSQEAGSAARTTSKRARADSAIRIGIAAHHHRVARVIRISTNISGISSENQTSQVSDQSGLLRLEVPNKRRASCHTSCTVGA